MAYRFSMDEPVERAVRRIAREEIDEALAAIRSPDLPVERAVHEVRRRCKALRALVRLVRPVFPGFAQQDAAFRDIARSLSGPRDARVLADTLAEITQDDEAAALAPLRDRFTMDGAGREATRGALDACTPRLQAARRRAARWTLEADGWDALSDGFARTVRSSRRSMKALGRTGDPHCSHEWRKHVKYHWHHMRLLRAFAPQPADNRIKQAERLADLLGDRHDLDQLADTLAATPGGADAKAIEALIARARKRAAKLEDKALRLGADLFDEKPRKLAAKWGEHWALGRERAREAEPA